MFNRFDGYDRTFSVFDELRRRMDSVWEDYQPLAFDPSFRASSSWPHVNVHDTGDTLVFTADVPGLADKEVQLTLTVDGLTLSGERKLTPPEGYSTQRQERPAAKFSRSWTLPYKVDADKTSATLKDGVLTITLAKAADAQPRQISVKAN
jgi:HSP20 family protein